MESTNKKDGNNTPNSSDDSTYIDSLTRDELSKAVREILDYQLGKTRKIPKIGKAKGSNGHPKPAVPINESITTHHLVCLECGGEFTMLRRHLIIEHGISHEDYKQRWGLPLDYPNVCKTYAEYIRKIFEKTRATAGGEPSVQDQTPARNSNAPNTGEKI